jgi:hypothetical protein
MDEGDHDEAAPAATAMDVGRQMMGLLREEERLIGTVPHIIMAVRSRITDDFTTLGIHFDGMTGWRSGRSTHRGAHRCTSNWGTGVGETPYGIWALGRWWNVRH